MTIFWEMATSDFFFKIKIASLVLKTDDKKLFWSFFRYLWTLSYWIVWYFFKSSSEIFSLLTCLCIVSKFIIWDSWKYVLRFSKNLSHLNLLSTSTIHRVHTTASYLVRIQAYSYFEQTLSDSCWTKTLCISICNKIIKNFNFYQPRWFFVLQ